jgi:hypothetical protein
MKKRVVDYGTNALIRPARSILDYPCRRSIHPYVLSFLVFSMFKAGARCEFLAVQAGRSRTDVSRIGHKRAIEYLHRCDTSI